MSTVTIAIAQIDIALGDREQNLTVVSAEAERAASHNADILLLPELWGSGYDLERAPNLADGIDEGLFAAMADLAQKHRLAICGSLLERRGDGVYNTAALYDAEGQRRAAYSKLHLFGMMAEGRYLAPGDEIVCAEMPWGKTGIAICYDLRFPEQFRSMALDGAALVLLPAEWPDQRIEHWRTLVRARAIENQYALAACNRVGADRANTFGGRSALIDATGATQGEAGTDAELLVGTIDLAAGQALRERIPVLHDRRPELYRLGPQDSRRP